MTTATAPQNIQEALELAQRGGPQPLTKQDVAAIRKADDIDARLDQYGQHWIHCIKRRTPAELDDDPYLEDQVYKILVGGGVTSYEAYEAPLVAYGDISKRYGHCTAFKHLVRVGDIVRLVWVRGNNCQYLTEKNLTRDELHVSIVRATDKNGRRPIEFTTDVRVTPNNTARMTRTYRGS